MNAWRWLSFIVLPAACAGNDPSSASQASDLSGPVTVQIRSGDVLFQANATEVTAVVVTLNRIDAKSERGDWVTVATNSETVNLLSLKSGTFATLGIGSLPVGQFDKLRLFVNPSGPNYVETGDGTRHPLIVPSDAILVNGDLDIRACATGSVVLRLDDDDPVEVHPVGAGFVLRPVISVDVVSLSDPDNDHTGDCDRNER